MRKIKYKLISGEYIKEKHIKSALDLDYICYDSIYFLDLDVCLSYYMKNPYIYLMVIDSLDNVLGYINFSPIKEDVYEFIKKGKIIDTCITEDSILKYEQDGIYSVYFSSICVHPAYRNKGIAKQLIEGLFELQVKLKTLNITISRIIADVVSKEGEDLIQNLGFNFICITEHNSKIYEKVM